MKFMEVNTWQKLINLPPSKSLAQLVGGVGLCSSSSFLQSKMLKKVENKIPLFSFFFSLMMASTAEMIRGSLCVFGCIEIITVVVVSIACHQLV